MKLQLPVMSLLIFHMISYQSNFFCRAQSADGNTGLSESSRSPSRGSRRHRTAETRRLPSGSEYARTTILTRIDSENHNSDDDDSSPIQSARHSPLRGRQRRNRRRDRERPDGGESSVDAREDSHLPDAEDDNLPTEPGSAEFPANCSHCWIREERKRLRLEEIKAHILSKLRLEAPPNISAKRLPDIPFLSRMIVSASTTPEEPILPSVDGEDDYHARTSEVLNFCSPPPPHIHLNSSDICYFTFQDQVLRSQIISAHVWVYIRSTIAAQQHGRTLILVYRLRRGGGRQLIGQKRVQLNEQSTGKYYHFDIRRQVEGWIRHPHNNLGLQIEAFDHNGNSLAVITPADENDINKTFLEVKIQDLGSPRNKRSMQWRNCNAFSLEVNCCRFPLEIDFTEFRWDWIVAPTRYEANYCSGECPFVYLPKYPHTHFIQQNSKPDSSVGPCCTPTKVLPISMIYLDGSGNVIMGHLPGMITDRCGCA